MYPPPEICSFRASAECTRASDRPGGTSRPSTYHTGLALPMTRNTHPSSDRPDVRAQTQTRPDIRGQRPPRRTSEIPTHRTFGTCSEHEAADAHLLYLYSNSYSWWQPPSAFSLAQSARATHPPFPDQEQNRNNTSVSACLSKM
jgi:hypothetical protein